MLSLTDFILSPPLSPPVPLPQVPGPKLIPFTPTAHADIEFIRNLGRPNDKDTRVWKVKINKCGPFALKMFFFNSGEHLERSPGNYLNNHPLAKRQSYVDYLDPFNCECRAYGRLKQEEREDRAIKAYGYLLITPEQEAEVTRRIEGDPEIFDELHGSHQVLNGDNTWRRYEQYRGHPIRAIVKQLVSDDAEPFGVADIPHLWSDLEELHKPGILVRDVHIGKYLGGKLIDFSRSWAMYHPCLDRTTPSLLQEIRQSEAEDLFDLLITWFNLNPNEQLAIPERLDYCVNTLTDDVGYDPRRYNWRKWEEDVRMADSYIAHELFKS
ncbi:kinetochore Sim4 complex subunit FTA2-domain-containing protein [Chaetomium strumarium]|uniref:Kinetochore Sim4 complex subunit FTA2-domain-containing protein n=1 Tax=Chaetomium strumarium TaxID=1170767 RepID=A0AAJ0GNY1_9PEZI|nr:kinetochore Sim4 complex subunit FTA2-domain-containing protein [Chaetomium strumarium]